MTWRYIILNTAQQDFEEVEGYLSGAAPERLKRFTDDFEATVRTIAEHPMLRPQIRPHVCRESLSAFKYHVWYRRFPEIEYFEVFALVHYARSPQVIEDRL